LERRIAVSEALEISNASMDERGNLHVTISGHRFWAGEKYTILELGWAVYVAEDEVPEEWMRIHGETRPADAEWSEFASKSSMLVTSHPVLVALSLRAWLHRNGVAIETTLRVDVPSFDEAVEEVRAREILNDFNQCHAGTVPGLARWGRGDST
jgi:hypothetical protein